MLHDRKVESKHGSGVVNRLSYDLKQRYPQMGVSPRNLERARGTGTLVHSQGTAVVFIGSGEPVPPTLKGGQGTVLCPPPAKTTYKSAFFIFSYDLPKN